MAVTKVPTAGTEQSIRPIPQTPPVGVREDGYRKELAFNSKRRPINVFSPETSVTSGQVFGTQVR